jgi:hypothetical protein
MKKNIIFFINIIFLISIYSQENEQKEKNDITQKIYLEIYFDKDDKINKKTIIYDLTSDIPKYLKGKDTTSDLLKSNKFIFKEEDINHFKENLNFFSNFLKEKLENLINNKEMEIILNDKSENEKNGIIININIFEYTEGEYNLIFNRNTNIKLIVKLYKKDSNTNLFLLQIYSYNFKSELLNPTEEIRLNNLSVKLSNDIYKKLIYFKLIDGKSKLKKN